MTIRRHFAAGASAAGIAALFAPSGLAFAQGVGREQGAVALGTLLDVIVQNQGDILTNFLNNPNLQNVLQNARILNLNDVLNGNQVNVLSDILNNSSVLSNLTDVLSHNTVLTDFLNNSLNHNNVLVPVAVNVLSGPTIYVFNPHG
jgi:hypothetical protein